MNSFELFARPFRLIFNRIKASSARIPVHEVIKARYIWEGTTAPITGLHSIAGPIEAIIDNYDQISKISGVCTCKNGVKVIVPFASATEHVQICVNDKGEIFCDATENFIDCPISIIFSYDKPL